LIDQPKKGRPRSENPMVHTAVVLPRDLLEKLRTDAAAANRGLSAEIRQRLQLGYLVPREPYDHETSQLLAAIKLLSESLARDLGAKWHEHTYALAAFKAGVEAFLARYYLAGDEDRRPDAQDADEPDDPPDVVGRTHARLIEIGNHEDEGK
jgi:hypothetical protein